MTAPGGLSTARVEAFSAGIFAIAATLLRALQGGGDSRPAAALYGAVLAVTSAVFTAPWAYLRGCPHLLEPAARYRAGTAVRRSLAGPALYVVAVLVALANAPVSLAVDALVAAWFVRPARKVVAA